MVALLLKAQGEFSEEGGDEVRGVVVKGGSGKERLFGR